MPNVIDKTAALAYVENMLTQLCRCGCLESEHLFTRHGGLGACDECACKGFKQAYTVKSLLEEMLDAR